MNWLAYVSWLAGPAGQITLLVLMLRSGWHRTFPRFFSYVLFQLVKTVCLFAIYRFFPGELGENYFDAYWTGNAVSVLFAVAVMDEILHQLFVEYGGIQTMASTIFRWACGLLVLVSIVGAISGYEGSADRVTAAILSFERSLRLMQCGLFLLIMLLCRTLRHCWKQPVFGVALGFGVFASIELILITLATFYGSSGQEMLSLTKSLAYNGITLIWIAYLRKEPEKVPVLEVAPQGNTFSLALATPEPVAGDASFLSMVEQAVDRVLSRHTWPAPPTRGSQIVGRTPGPEERN